MKALRSQTLLSLLLLGPLTLSAQIRLPGGITIGEPGQPPRPGRSNTAPGRPNRPDPNQVCPSVAAWLALLQTQYPGVDLRRTVSDKVQLMAIPLFADDAFAKQFGVSYTKLSDVERREFMQTHFQICQTSRDFAQQTSLVQILNAPFLQPATSTASPISPGNLLPALGRLQSSRATLASDEQTLASTPPSPSLYDTATALPAQRKAELAAVWPSEQARFQSAVKDSLARSASPAVQAKVDPLLSAPASPEVLKQLADAPMTYAQLFAALPDEKRSAMEGKLADRRAAVIRELLPAQQARALGFPPTREGLDAGAEWYLSYQAVFLRSPVIAEADALSSKYLAQRQAVLARLAPQMEKGIQTGTDAGVVASLYDEIFRLPSDKQTPTYEEIAKLRAARAQLLTERSEQARIAAEQKAEKAALAHGELVASSLKVANLSNPQLMRTLFIGDFAHAGLTRSDIMFHTAFNMYLEDFGRACPSSLPADKAQMTYPDCDQYWVTTNGYGTEISRQCTNYIRTAIPGVYADPRAFNADVELEGTGERNLFINVLKGLGGPDPLGHIGQQTGNLVVEVATLHKDIPTLITENGCGSKALARLEENMTRFALNDDPIHVAGFAPDTSHSTRVEDLDASALADDLIRANAAGWLLNQYLGLDGGASVEGRPDKEGRPRRVHATYSQKGITNSGTVDIAFTDGLPSCLYFGDDPNNCKAPSPAVVKRYEDGVYRKRANR